MTTALFSVGVKVGKLQFIGIYGSYIQNLCLFLAIAAVLHSSTH
ncbi:MAG: hypothetical protein RMX68_018635 [Aulosira sp. ZfuVER01]|nr:hypothetical protein [Aulosira sp. DedVER01a]MDZ8051295.1 hypothetical protein [Aulosira sp. ZfuCHP01]